MSMYLSENGCDMCRIVLSGYFCTGKTSIMRRLNTELGLKKPKDFTTRSMRDGEKEGDPYFFITREQFSYLESIGKLFDPIEYAGNMYAVDYDDLFQTRHWVMDILPDSWDKFSRIPRVIGVYLIPPAIEILKERALSRGDSIASVGRRINAIRPQNLSVYHYAIEPQESLDALFQRVKAICQQALN